MDLNIFEEYLDYSREINEFLRENKLSSKIESALFLVFDEMQKNIIYYYGVNENYNEKYAKISGADLEVIESNDIYDLCKIVNTEYFVLTLNCYKYTDKNALSRMFFLSKDLDNDWMSEIKKINFGYWNQIVINVQNENRYYNSVYNIMVS